MRHVDRQSDVVIGEVRTAFGIEQFEQQFDHAESGFADQAIHAVDHQHGVAHAGFAQRAQDLSGLSAGQSARLAAQFDDVGGAGHADAHERTAQRARDGSTQRRLAGAGRADQTQCRARQIGLEHAHREILDDAFLGLVESHVLAVEHAPHALEVGVLGRRAFPRQRPQPLQIGAHLSRFGRALRQSAQPVHLALRLTRDLARKMRRLPGAFNASHAVRVRGLGAQRARALACYRILRSHRSGHWVPRGPAL